MKRAFLFMTCLVASLAMSAQGSDTYFDYIPFVKEGKVWHVARSTPGQVAIDEVEYYIPQGIEEIEEVNGNGKAYYKMKAFTNNTTETGMYLIREEDRKVYLFDTNTQKEYLMFDYSLKAGDTYETYSYDSRKVVSYKVLSVGICTECPGVRQTYYNQQADSTEISYRSLRKWTVCRTDNESIQKTWIEGVGSLEGPLANLYDSHPTSSRDYLAYIEFVDDVFDNSYLPFSFYDKLNRKIHGSNLPKGAEDNWESVGHQLTYELEDDRLHVYGKAYTQCGPNNYAYFIEKPTDDPLVHKIEFVIQEVAPVADCMSLHKTNFYVSGFDPNMNYIVVDNQGGEHPVVNKTPQLAYRPFVEEGKVWKVGTISGNPVQVVDCYYFDGDTIIGGKTCKQMMCQRYVAPDYSNDKPSLSKVGAWYEEDKKVYFCNATNNLFKLMYDFSVNADDTLLIDNQSYVIGPKQSGGMKGFKGVYRDVNRLRRYKSTPWLEGVGGLYGLTTNVIDTELGDPALFLMSCTVGDEVIYLNDDYEDGATPDAMNARKQRIDFTHTIKVKPKAPIKRETSDACINSSECEVARPEVKARMYSMTPMRRAAEESLYGEYNDVQLGINLNPLDDAYLVRITDETGKSVYEKAVNAGSIVGLNIDISAYPKGSYTVTVENNSESFTGEFEAQTTGIVENINIEKFKNESIYDLQGRRLTGRPTKGVYIENGRKLYVK